MRHEPNEVENSRRALRAMSLHIPASANFNGANTIKKTLAFVKYIFPRERSAEKEKIWLILAKILDKIQKIWYKEKVTIFWKPPQNGAFFV